MNVLNILIGLYARLHNYPGVPYWVLTPLRIMVRGVANRILPRYLARERKATVSGKGVVVSFTSFPAHINDVWHVVDSLKNQSVRPEKIILWLSREQFPKPDDVPESLKDCEDALFEIRMVDGDIRSHTKYFYAMQEYPDKSIVTCDDDIYYHRDTLMTLIEASRLYPGCIIANISNKLMFDDKGEVLPYAKWDKTFSPFASENRVQVGDGGVLYPPHSLPDIALRKDLILELAPLSDDLWLNVMARLNKTPVVQSGKEILPLSVNSNATSIKTVNDGAENMNDKQLARIRKWLEEGGYEDVYESDYKIDKSLEGGKIIVSLTSFPARINSVWQVVSCMLLQTIQPHEIILWLSKDQFPTKESIPESLRRLEGDVFKIRMVDGDLRSHKKYFYVAKEHPDDYVFLIDDDLYYPTTILEKSWRAHLAHPDAVISNYGYHIKYNDNGTLADYREWQECYDSSNADDLFFGSGGGTLLKPSKLYPSLTDIDLATTLAPMADDIWLNAMVRLNKVPILMLKNGLIIPIAIKNNVKLASENKFQSKNDEQLGNVINHFTEICGINPFARVD